MESRHTIGLVMSVIDEENGGDETLKNSELDQGLDFGDLPQQEENKSSASQV
jgi:hypothetical protein